MKFSWFLALRYLKPKRTFISIITVISVAGVALWEEGVRRRFLTNGQPVTKIRHAPPGPH